MRKIIVLFILIGPVLLFAQSATYISLEQCLKATAQNFPLSNQKILISAANELNQQVIQTGFLPQLVLNGQVSYQSDVTSLPITLPNVSIPQTSKDWYKLNVDISQLIYDGGALKTQQKLASSDANIEIQSVEIELYKIKEIVQTSFFNTILLNENKKTILLLQTELKEKLKNIESGIRNGLILLMNSDNLLAELIKIEQNIYELELGIESAISNLNILTGLQLSSDNTFILPPQSTPLNTQNTRPELGLFDLQVSKLNLLKDMTAIKRKPIVMGFGQAGYGRPALNMLSNDFEPYFMVGAKLSWKVFDWGNNKKEKKSLDLKSQIISKNKETFNKQLDILLTKKMTEIKRLENFLIKDEQIVNLKTKIAKAVSSQFENGQITATDYLLEKNAETKAMLNFQLHQVQLRHAQIDYEYTLGNLNN